MKTITIPKTELPTTEILRGVLSHGGTEGLSIGDIRARMKILDKIDKVDVESTSIALEDDEHAIVKKAFDGNRFTIVHPDLVKISDAIDGAK